MDKIKFGTDGWRGVIGDDFTFANVRRVVAAVAEYVRQEDTSEKGLVIGYDTRFLSPECAKLAAEVVSGAGIPVWLADRATPTPAVSYAVVTRQTAGALMITASHNPYRWNGIKFKASYGGSASQPIMRRIEAHLRRLDRESGLRRRPRKLPIQTTDLVTPYLERLKTLVNLGRIKASARKFVIDPMYGTGAGCIARLFADAGIPHREIHAERNPIFPGLNPEPIDPHLAGLRQAILEGGEDAGLATDGDADRVGAIDRSGMFVDSHKIFSILLKHLVEDLNLRGEVVKTFSTTQMIDKLACKHGLPLHITPIGFKYICEFMLTRNILIGGEESGGIGIKGHIPERDGILNSLLLAEVMADRGCTLGELVQELNEEFGPHFYGRVDLELEKAAIKRVLKHVGSGRIKSFAGHHVSALEDLDGLKMLFGDDGWLLIRPSGTENVLRLYAESRSPEEVQKLLNEISALARA